MIIEGRGSCGTCRVEMALCHSVRVLRFPSWMNRGLLRCTTLNEDRERTPSLVCSINVRASHSSPYRSGSPLSARRMQDSSSVLRMSQLKRSLNGE